MASAETSVGVTTFFNDGVTEDKIMEIKTAIELRDEVESVEYVSADQAWDQFKDVYFNGEGNTEAMTNLESDNPLAGSDSLTIYLKDTSKQQELVDYLNTIPEVRRVNASKSLADSFTNFSRLLGYASLGIIVILVAVAIFLISNTVTIGITVRKEEIAIMKYIGATDMFVKGPFYVEGIVIGLVGSAIPVVILRFLYIEVVNLVNEHFASLASILKFSDAHSIFIWLVPISLGIGLVIGFVGSFFTLRKHIRV